MLALRPSCDHLLWQIKQEGENQVNMSLIKGIGHVECFCYPGQK